MRFPRVIIIRELQMEPGISDYQHTEKLLKSVDNDVLNHDFMLHSFHHGTIGKPVDNRKDHSDLLLC